jgi:hypothetical protein
VTVLCHLLVMADPATIVSDPAERLEQSRYGIWDLCRRFEDRGLDAIADAGPCLLAGASRTAPAGLCRALSETGQLDEPASYEGSRGGQLAGVQPVVCASVYLVLDATEEADLDGSPYDRRTMLTYLPNTPLGSM